METKEVIAEVVFEAQLVTSVKGWVVDSTHTRHIGTFKEEFTSQTLIAEGIKPVFIRGNKLVLESGKGKVLLKLTSSKILSLTKFIHIPHFRHNLVSVHLLGTTGIKILFDGDIVNLSKNKVFDGKGYDADGLFVLNVNQVINENGSSSCAYLVDSINEWHGKLGHLNLSYKENKGIWNHKLIK